MIAWWQIVLIIVGIILWLGLSMVGGFMGGFYSQLKRKGAPTPRLPPGEYRVLATCLGGRLAVLQDGNMTPRLYAVPAWRKPIPTFTQTVSIDEDCIIAE